MLNPLHTTTTRITNREFDRKVGATVCVQHGLCAKITSKSVKIEQAPTWPWVLHHPLP